MFFLTKVTVYNIYSDTTETNYGLMTASSLSAAANEVVQAYTDPQTHLDHIEALTLIPIGDADIDILDLDEEVYHKFAQEWAGVIE